MNIDPGLQLDLLGALQRRLGMIAVAVGVCLLAAYWIAMALPNYYQSSATIFIEPQALNQRLIESGTNAQDLGYRLSLMSAQILSRPRLSRVIDEFGLYENESKTMLREEVINLMRARIQVVPVETDIAETKSKNAPELNTFKVVFTHKDPKVAAEVAQRLANDFVKEHIEERVGMTRKSLEFIQSELDRVHGERERAEGEIARVKDENRGSLPEDLAANQRVLDRTLAELREAHRSLDTARSNKAFWDTQVLTAVSTADPRDDASPARRLQMLELKIAEYKARGFTDRHPDMIAAREEMAAVRAKIANLDPDEQEDRAPSIAQQNAESQRDRAALEVQMGQKEVERLQAAADALETRIAKTPRVAEQLEQLNSLRQQLANDASLFSSRHLQARMQVNVERRQLGEQFRILEAAFPAPTPSSPNRLLIIVMGLVIGMAVGVGGAVVAEASDSSFHVVRDVQTTLELPVLAAIPDIVLESDRAERRRRFLRNLVAAGFVVVFCLTGGVVTYLYVNGMPGWLSGGGEEEAAPADEPPPDSARFAVPDVESFRA